MSTRRGKRRRRASTKLLKTYRVSTERIAVAQMILGTSSATETIEMALDMVVFRREMLDSTCTDLDHLIESMNPS